jgi:PKD repeat protein
LDELNTAQFDLSSVKVGDYTVQFTAIDPFQKEATISMNLFVFNNLKPVAKFVVDKNAINSPNEYALDASDSYDQDRYQGGEVKYYFWKINGVLEVTNQPVYRVIFDKQGVYEVILIVKDNDGEDSIEVKQQITI